MSIMNKLKIIVFLLLTGNYIQAQNVANYATIDKQTYNYFIEKDWKSVVSVGNRAITEGVDYYYLRYRIGVAFYELKQYRAAITHFEKALVFNEFDAVSKEYLYYAYLFSERYYDAEKLSATFNKPLKKQLNIKPSPLITTIITEGGIKLANYDSLKTLSFASIGIGHKLGDNGITAFHNLSTVNQTVYYGKISQNEYYLNVNIPLKNRLTIQPVVHLIDLTLNSTNKYVNSFHRTDFLAGVQVTKGFNLFDITLNASQSNLYNKSQTQIGVGINYYPLLNNQLVLSASGTFQKDSTTNSTLFQVGVKYRPTNKLELSAHYFSGNALNTNELNGYLVNNSYDVLKDRIGIMARFNATNHLTIYGLGQLENRTESYYKVAYKNTTVAVGLQWTF
jgi:tetratricopeptide (TPR) repeat protein